jgi:hypothetical protein
VWTSANTTYNFTYTGSGITADATVELTALSATLGWQAVNKVALNDCEASGNNACKCQVQLDNGTKGGQISYATCLSTNAKPLTANFESIGASSTPCTLK